MRLVAVLAAAAALAGCQQVETQGSIAAGLLQVEPHPIHRDSVRIVTVVSAVALDPLGRGTEEGNRNVVVAVLGEECAGAQIIEEGRIRRRHGRVDAALRVVCPAAVAR